MNYFNSANFYTFIFVEKELYFEQMKRHLILTIILTIFSINAYSQLKSAGLPYIKNYSAEDYSASSQNWDVCQDKRGILYFANTVGIMEFDGVDWRLINTSNNSAVKSLATDTATGRVYVGAKGDFGYLHPNTSGKTEYVSLLDKIPEKSKNFADVWSIHFSQKEGICFETTTGLYFYKNDTINVIQAKGDNGFRKVFLIDDKLFVYYSGNGLREISDGKLWTVKGTEPLIKVPVIAIFRNNNSYTIITSVGGMFSLENNTLTKLETPVDSLLLNDLYCAVKLSDGNYALGTLSKGLIITDKNFNCLKIVNIASGLISNQITSLYENKYHGLWICTTNGLSFTDLYSPFSTFTHGMTGINGTIRSILSVDDMLYMGADNVFLLQTQELNTTQPHIQKFTEVLTSKGRQSIWKLDTLYGKLFVGGVKGLFTVKNMMSENVDKDADRNIREFVISAENKELMIAGGGLGLTLFGIKNGNPVFKKGISGFQEYARHIAEDNDHNFWISEKSKGIFKIRFNHNFDSVIYCKKYDTEQGLPSVFDNYLFKTPDKLIFGTVDGFYIYNQSKDIFEPYKELNDAIGKKTVDFLYCDSEGNYWIKEVSQDKNNPDLKYWDLEKIIFSKEGIKVVDAPFKPYKSRINSFADIGNGCYIIGDVNCFIHYDEKIKKDFMHGYPAFIRKLQSGDSIYFAGTFFDENMNISETQKSIQNIVLEYEQNNITITFAALTDEYPEKVRYKIYLEGNDRTWSDWRNENKKEYSNLSPGTYIFHVIAQNIYGAESYEATLKFEVLSPWYLSICAYIAYILLFIGLIILIIKAYTRSLVKEKEKLEQIVRERTKEISLKNEEITQKNKSITDSINYAKHIQTSMLPEHENILHGLPEYFILFRPKDIVSGDYYWYAENEKEVVFAAVDCTGHGVPGAFMSMIGAEILTNLATKGITSPDDLLTYKNRYVRKALKQDTGVNQDGMDMALCTINKSTHTVWFAGAKNPLVYIQKGELYQIKADKQSIGGNQLNNDYRFTKHEIKVDSTTEFYMFSDGYEDQFGGPMQRKFMIKNLKELLFSIHDKPMSEQKEILNKTIENWIGSGEQTDDILVVGFRVYPV